MLGFRNAWAACSTTTGNLSTSSAAGDPAPGGTIPGHPRVQPYQFPDGVDRVRAAMEHHRLDGFVVIGATVARRGRGLHADGVSCIGVPKTIDNDIAAPS